VKANLSENKRDAILRRVNNLQDEVDRDRTRTEAAMGLLLELTSVVSKGAKNLDPAIDRMERIIKVFAKAKDSAEMETLSPPSERRRLSPPKKAPEADKPTDEEIAF
jgi:hypothetical protein